MSAILGARWAVDMWALGCLLWEAATADCLPMGTGGGVLGRQALEAPEIWQTRLHERIATFASALDRLPPGRAAPPPGAVADARRGLVGVLAALWQPAPLARPGAADVAALPMWHPDCLCLKLPRT